MKLTFKLLAMACLLLPLAAQTPAFKPQQKRWWAIQPVAAPAVPELDAVGSGWVKNEIDSFVYEKLKAKAIAPSAMADRATFLRRATLDLTGLPPTPAEGQAFLADTRPGAEERLVDRLLATPRYGERWGRHWLDVVRYADSDGFKQDDTRPNMWRYRDWVIQSFNNDKPWNRFVREQIAADEIYPGDLQALPGLGYLRLFEDEYNQAHIRLRRQELLNDLTDNTAFAFLGVTLGCARCHDHKFDPLLHRDYYRLQAFFSNLRIHDEAALVPAKEIAEHEAKLAKYGEAARPVLDKLEAFLAGPRARYYKEYTERFPEEVQTVIRMNAQDRTPLDWQIYHKAITQVYVPDAEVINKRSNTAGESPLQRAFGRTRHIPAADAASVARGPGDARSSDGHAGDARAPRWIDRVARGGSAARLSFDPGRRYCGRPAASGTAIERTPHGLGQLAG